MNTVDGYAMSSWERGYGDFEMRPDIDTLRRVPWQEGTALCLADVAWADARPVVASPRQILRRQLERLAERGWEAFAGTELEFMVFRDTYEEAWDGGYRDLEPGQPLQRRLLDARHRPRRAAHPPHPQRDGRRGHGGRELQGRVQLRPARDQLPLRRRRCATADEHVIYKNGAKEIAAQEGMAITYMAKFDEREGNSCHIHLSLRATTARRCSADDPSLFERFLAGQLATLRELTLFLAPNVNSYKRFAEGSFAPTAVAWGLDNRTCALRVVGHGAEPARRVPPPGRRRQPVPRARRDHRRRACTASTTSSSSSRPSRATPTSPTSRACPTTLREARDLFAGSAVAREAFGDEVVDHYLNNARRRARRVRRAR